MFAVVGYHAVDCDAFILYVFGEKEDNEIVKNIINYHTGIFKHSISTLSRKYLIKKLHTYDSGDIRVIGAWSNINNPP